MYKVILMSFDGDYATDSEHETIEQANDAAGNLSSKWYFYPWYFCVKNQTVVDASGVFVNTKTGEPVLSSIFKRKRFKTVQNTFRKVSKMTEAESMSVDEFESFLIDYLKN